MYLSLLPIDPRKVLGSRNRKVRETEKTNGGLQEKVLRIRRLQCQNCLKTHHELPDRLSRNVYFPVNIPL
ncbi:DUF6431 domain-containing protein [Alkaliphilus metalliredigens]|uniref:DUF6431 domain-containing protein n=1 Tax=Alkaliphilus metalliredigens TaxID=208226 RepID=UPI0038CC19CA